MIGITVPIDGNQNCYSSIYFTVPGYCLKNEIGSPRSTMESMECWV